MSQIVGALLRSKEQQEIADAPPCCFDGSFFRLSNKRFQLGEHHFDRVEVRAVGRQEQEMCAAFADCCPCGRALVASQIVQDDDIACLQRRNEALPDPSGERSTIDGPVEHTGCDDAVSAQPGQKGQGLPVTMRNPGDQRLPALAPATGAGHVGLDPGFVDEDKPFRIKAMLVRLPARPEPGNLRSVLLARHQCFF